jgi:hypothetical protein
VLVPKTVDGIVFGTLSAFRRWDAFLRCSAAPAVARGGGILARVEGHLEPLIEAVGAVMQSGAAELLSR